MSPNSFSPSLRFLIKWKLEEMTAVSAGNGELFERLNSPEAYDAFAKVGLLGVSSVCEEVKSGKMQTKNCSGGDVPRSQHQFDEGERTQYLSLFTHLRG